MQSLRAGIDLLEVRDGAERVRHPPSAKEVGYVDMINRNRLAILRRVLRDAVSQGRASWGYSRFNASDISVDKCVRSDT